MMVITASPHKGRGPCAQALPVGRAFFMPERGRSKEWLYSK